MENKPFPRRGFLAAASSFLLAGCGGNLLGPSQPEAQIYVLRPGAPPATPAAPGARAR